MRRANALGIAPTAARAPDLARALALALAIAFDVATALARHQTPDLPSEDMAW